MLLCLTDQLNQSKLRTMEFWMAGSTFLFIPENLSFFNIIIFYLIQTLIDSKHSRHFFLKHICRVKIWNNWTCWNRIFLVNLKDHFLTLFVQERFHEFLSSFRHHALWVWTTYCTLQCTLYNTHGTLYTIYLHAQSYHVPSSYHI